MTPRNANEYVTTDLAIESGVQGDAEGVEYSERDEGNFNVALLRVKDERGERAAGRPAGTYVTVTLGRPWLFDDRETEAAVDLLAREISALARAVSPCESVLVIGLGNRGLTADALGPEVADGLLITRHVKFSDSALFDSLMQAEISSLAPGVLAQTGIETAELVRGAVERVKPDLCIAVDALAARGVERLATTVQLCDVGLAPGSGVGNKRGALNAGTLGVPVLAIGAPTVVNSATLVRDALSLAGMEEVPAELEKALENGRSFFVSLKESDVAVKSLAHVISEAINRAFKRG